MKIGIDFDDTIVNTKEIVNEYLKKYNLDGFNNLDEKIKFYKKHIDEITKLLTLKPNVIAVLNKLSMNNELYLITARNNFFSENVENLVLEFINNNKLPFKEIYFDCYKEQKANKCKELGIELFIDDLDENCQQVKNIGINTLIFENECDGFTTVNSWDEILKYVEVNYGRKNSNQ